MEDSVVVTSIDGLADCVRRRVEPGVGARTVVAVAGPPASGKSTIAAALADALNAGSPGSAAVLAMDGFHYDDLVLEERGWRPNKGAPHTFDFGGLRQMLERLSRNNEPEVAAPIFDRSIEIARAGACVIPQDVRVLVVEGNYLLLDEPPWNALSTYFDLSIFLDVAEDELSRRLVQRWSHLKPERQRQQIDDNDLPNVRLVQSLSRPSEVIFRQTP